MNYIKAKLYLIIAILMISLIGCSSGEKKEQASTFGQMQFTVVDSLLGDTLHYEESGLMISIPRGFFPLPDSIRMMAQKSTAFLRNDTTGSIKVYLNQSRGSGLIVSLLTDLDLDSDTSKFLLDYYNALVQTHGEEGITVGDYWIDDVLVKNFLITDSQSVMFDLICLTKNRNAMHVQYLVPKQFYGEMIKTLESSIGSITAIK